MIKFEHSIFALPFALSALLLAHREHPVTWRLVFWIIMAMLWARSAAMGFNRLADARWDAKNPRTADREIPAGAISLRETTLFIVVTSILFVLSAAAISPICFWFSFPVLLLLFGYSYTKRFTWHSHLVLGLVQALAPPGVWIAVTGDFAPKILILSLTICTYIAGFDLLYACQDVEFDRKEGLYSMPASLGIGRAMIFSSLLHVVTFLSLLALYPVFALSPVYLGFTAAIGVLLIAEHRLVKPHDLSRINVAFYHVNSVISILLFAAFMTEELVRGVF
ncbi:MAG: UbiA family prenyltransferase [Deltaproteobacteria bacterium]|nr:UbiA family prenyltransferase [Deltaproteobacteria bacterium]